MTAGLATVDLITAPDFFQKLAATTTQLMLGMKERAAAANIPLYTTSVGGMFGFYFTDKKIETFADLKYCDIDRFKKFFHAMLQAGIYLAPSAYEAGFLSSAHGEKELAKTFSAIETSLQKL